MIVTSSKFRTVVENRGYGVIRVCTGQYIPEEQLHADDYVCPASKVPDETVLVLSEDAVDKTVLIRYRQDVARAVRPFLMAAWALVMATFLLMCIAFWAAFKQWLVLGGFRLSTHLVGGSAAAVLFLFSFKQVLNPIVHDAVGHWVNLRNGSSNLCDGIVIQKKAR